MRQGGNQLIYVRIFLYASEKIEQPTKVPLLKLLKAVRQLGDDPNTEAYTTGEGDRSNDTSLSAI